jgi:sulfur carrier protein
MALTVTLNGQPRRFEALDDGVALADVVAELGLQADRIAIECNGEIAGRSGWATHAIHAGDRLEIVHFVGGGSGRFS